MKALTVVLLSLVSCKAVIKPSTTPRFHVTAASSCADVSATGVMGGVEYALTRPADAPLGVACYGLLGPGDVGKDFPAKYDRVNGIITVTMSDSFPAHYAVSAARELLK